MSLYPHTVVVPSAGPVGASSAALGGYPQTSPGEQPLYCAYTQVNNYTNCVSVHYWHFGGCSYGHNIMVSSSYHIGWICNRQTASYVRIDTPVYSGTPIPAPLQLGLNNCPTAKCLAFQWENCHGHWQELEHITVVQGICLRYLPTYVYMYTVIYNGGIVEKVCWIN